MTKLIEDGAELTETDKNGVTALHFAVRFRNVGAVQALLEQGADVDATCKRSGSTPLHRAVTYTGAPETAGLVDERVHIIAMLLDAGADPSIQNKAGKTPLEYAKDDAALLLLGSTGSDS